MKKLALYAGLMLAAATTLLTSCKKESSSGKTSSQITFALGADNATSNIAATTNSSLTLNATVAANASITWSSAIANISAYKFEAKKNGVSVEIKSKQLTNVDLFALSPASIGAVIDTGTYKQIEISILLLKSTAALPLVAKGTFTTAGGVVVPIEFDYNDNAVFNVEAENVTVDGTTDVISKINFHLNRLLSGISSATLDAASRTNGSIVISSSSNAAIYNRVIANVTLAFEARAFEKHKK